MKIKKIISLLFSRFVIFYLIPFKKRGYITCAGKSDGLGAQTQAIYSTFLYCHVNGLRYCHTPLQEIAHNYDNDVSFNNQAELFFGFAVEEEYIHALKQGYSIINLDDIDLKSIILLLKYSLTSGHKFIFQKSNYHNYTDKIAAKYSLIKEVLQQKYYAQPKENPFNDGLKKLHIAYHIRRGDVNNTDTLRYTDNQLIYLRLQKLTGLLKKLNIESDITIYSQGNPEDFGNLFSIAQLQLNSNVFDDFNRMVQSDILFMAKSSFSYSAALLSDGIILYEPFWHQPLDEWFKYKNDGFSSEFQDALVSKYSLKKAD